MASMAFNGASIGLATHPHTPIGPDGQFKTGPAQKTEARRTDSPPAATAFTWVFGKIEPPRIMRPNVENSATNVAPSPRLSPRDQSFPAQRVSRAGPALNFFRLRRPPCAGPLAVATRPFLETI